MTKYEVYVLKPNERKLVLRVDSEKAAIRHCRTSRTIGLYGNHPTGVDKIENGKITEILKPNTKND